MGSKPKQAAPTQEEVYLRQRQTEDLAKLDEEENRRLKGLTRMRLGGRSLLGGAARSTSRGSGGSAGGGGGARSTSGSGGAVSNYRAPAGTGPRGVTV